VEPSGPVQFCNGISLLLLPNNASKLQMGVNFAITELNETFIRDRTMATVGFFHFNERRFDIYMS
jgi:hypothetical protein